jgi:dUTP pyrophosphatase
MWKRKKVCKYQVEEFATDPKRKHPTDAGFDVCALHDTIVYPHNYQIVRTGVKCAWEKGTVAFVWPKSKSNFLIGAGVIDADYQGEILVKIFNIMDQAIYIAKGEPIAQIVIVPVHTPVLEKVDCAHPVATCRGASGGIVSQM